MENSILNLCPFDPAYIIMGLVILVVVEVDSLYLRSRIAGNAGSLEVL